MTLKDLEHDVHNNTASFGLGLGSAEGGAEVDDENVTREQYRVIKKDPLFKVNF